MNDSAKLSKFRCFIEDTFTPPHAIVEPGTSNGADRAAPTGVWCHFFRPFNQADGPGLTWDRPIRGGRPLTMASNVSDPIFNSKRKRARMKLAKLANFFRGIHFPQIDMGRAMRSTRFKNQRATTNFANPTNKILQSTELVGTYFCSPFFFPVLGLTRFCLKFSRF